MAQINKPDDYFNTVTWTGDGSSSRNITGVGFQPDWVWVKCRNATVSHALYDAVRGASNLLNSNTTSAEGTNAAVNAFISDGFTVNSDSYVNLSSNTYVGWNWLGANGTASNTDGSITSTVSANTTTGFSIVSYTGNSTAGATVGHGLGVAPAMMIIKNRTSSSNTWTVYHHKLSNPATKFLGLNLTGAEDTSTTNFNSTVPSSSVITLGTDAGTNGSTTMIAYCFAEKKGYSKFGSYTGNGQSEDGPFIYTGFKPAFVIVKKYDSAGGNWVMWDNKRSDVPNANVNDQVLYPNASDAELSSATREIDTLSNGFKIRGEGGNINADADNFIYMAFAENPLVGTNNIPATAR